MPDQRPLADIVNDIWKAGLRAGEETSVRKCPFTNCGANIPASMFACRRHWYAIPTELRSEVWDAYNDYLADRITLAELRRRQQAVLDAVGPKE